MSPKTSSSTSSGLSLDYAILEDSDVTAKEIDEKVKKIARSINGRFKMTGKIKPVKVNKLIPNSLFVEKDETVFIQKLVGNRQLTFPDVVFLDNNLDGKVGTGLDAIKEISNGKLPLDSILYSNVQVVVEPDQANPYGRVWSSAYHEIDDVLRSAITKFYLTWTNPEHIRGLVLSRMADLDAAWNNLVSSLLKLSISKQGYFFEFAMTREGLDISRKAQNAAKISKTMESKKFISKGWPTKIANFTNRTKNCLSMRNDFAHNLTSGIGKDGWIIIKTKGPTARIGGKPDGYSREEIKKFFLDVTSLINDIYDADSRIRQRNPP